MNILNKLIKKELKYILNELKLQDFLKQFQGQRFQNFKHHSDHLNFMQTETGVFPEFQEFKNGILHFTHDSSEEWKETSDLKYDIFIKFYEWNKMLAMINAGKTSKEITDVLYSGDLGVYCSCHAFWYFYSYAASHKKADVVFQKIPSPITNPQLVGIGCKHLDACMNKSAIKFNYNTVKSEIGKFQKSINKKAVDKVLGKEEENE